MPTPQVVRLGIRLLEGARRIDPLLGLEERSDADICRLLRYVGFTVADETIPVPALPVPDGDRGGELYLGAVGPVLRQFLMLRTVFRYWPTIRDLDAADVAAVAAVFHVAGRKVGEKWQIQRVKDLLHDPRAWSGRSLADLLDLAEYVLEATDPSSPVVAPSTLQDFEDRARELYELGRTARRRSQYAFADQALSQAVALAKRSASWELAVRSYTALAASASQRGDYRRARKVLRRARALARREGLRSAEGAVLHEMFLLAADLGEDSNASRYAMMAHRKYGTGHPWLPRLAFDVGTYWVALGRFQVGLRLVRLALPYAERLEEEITAWGVIGRAAGGLGQIALFDEAAVRVQELRDRASSQHYLTEALLGLGRGAGSLGRWAEGEKFVREALTLARKRREGRAIFEAEAVLESLISHTRLQDAEAKDAPSTHTLADAFETAIGERGASV